MHQALLQAVRDHIRRMFNVTELGCEVTPDGRPVPMCGEWFFAVHPGSASNTASSSDTHLAEVFDFMVTVTRRTSAPPLDRIGANVMLDANGILAIARRMAIGSGTGGDPGINMNYDVLSTANNLLGPNDNGWIKPPVYLGMSFLGPQGPSWFFAEGDDGDAQCGVAVEVRFGRSLREQYIDVAT